MTSPTPLPDDSLLAAYARRGAYADCYATSVPGHVALPQFIEAFYTTPLFKLERWVLAVLLRMPSTDQQARRVASAQADRFAAWRVEQRSEREILLDAGQTRLWLAVAPSTGAGTTLRLGSAVLPLRRNGQFGWAFHALLGFHRLYSRMLLSAAARRVASGAHRSTVP